MPLSPTFHAIVGAMALVLDCEDGWPASHAGRVAVFARHIADALGEPPALAYYAGLLHDVGGSGLEASVVEHAEREFADDTARAHARLGADLVSPLAPLAPLAPLLAAHHERADGRGFPARLTGAQIPVGAQILRAADTLELALRRAEPGQRAAAWRGAAEALGRGEVSERVAAATATVPARAPWLVDAAFDAEQLRALHATPVPGFLPWAGSTPKVTLTPLLLLLGRLIDSRDPRATGRSTRVAYYAYHLASALDSGLVPWEAAWAGAVHELGTVAIPRRALAGGTWWCDAAHRRRVGAETGRLLGQIPGLAHLALGTTFHLARYDGPTRDGVHGEHIPLLGRVLALASRYDRLRSDGSHADAIAGLQREAGESLDPHLIDGAVEVLDRIAARAPAPPPAIEAWEESLRAVVGAARPAVPRPFAQGVLLHDLEPWRVVTLGGDLAIVAGREALEELTGLPGGPSAADFLGEDSVVDLRDMLQAARGRSGGVVTRYLFTPSRRPIEVVVERQADEVRLLVRSAVNRLSTLDRLAVFYRNFLASTEAVVFTDPEARIIDVNRAFLDLFGYSLREVVGRHSRILGSGRQNHAFYEQLWRAITDPAVGSWHGELVDRRKDGVEISVQMRITAVRDANGACIGYIAHHHDISARKRAEAELLRRDEELHRKNLELEHLSRFKSDMVAVTSHDLKSPLASIVGVTDLLVRNLGRLPVERTEGYLRRINDVARRLTAFVDDLLDLERIESGSLELDELPVRLDLLLEHLVGEIRDAQQGRIAVTLTAPAGLRLLADPARLEQVFGNLLANAAKFAPDGTAIDVGVGQASPGRLQITVDDRGPGIPPAQLDTVFERFYQVGGTGAASKRGHGAGLGLSIVKRLVELHGGRVWAENREDRGCRMAVELPALRADAAPAVALVLAEATADTLELCDALAARGAAVRRLDSASELRELLQVVDVAVVAIGRAYLDAATLRLVGWARAEVCRGAWLVLLDEEDIDPPPPPFDQTLVPPFVEAELRALAGHVTRRLAGARLDVRSGAGGGP